MIKILHYNINYFKIHFLLVCLLLLACRKENLDLYDYPENSVSIKEVIMDCNGSGSEEIKKFWISQMGCVPTNIDSSSFKIGETTVTFKKSSGAFYHYAINIPENQIENAYKWLIENTDLKIISSAETSADIIHKPKFNAHSVYFIDPMGNLVELIARHDLKNSAEGDFNPKNMLLKISDVTIITRSLKSSTELLRSSLALTELPGTTNALKPIGGKNGIITLMVPYKPYPPTDDIIAPAFNFGKLELVIKHPEYKTIFLPGSNTTIRTEP